MHLDIFTITIHHVGSVTQTKVVYGSFTHHHEFITRKNHGRMADVTCEQTILIHSPLTTETLLLPSRSMWRRYLT